MEMKIRDILRRLREDGWMENRHIGSHKRFIHPGRPGKQVTVPIHGSGTVRADVLASIMRRAGWEMRYPVVIERASTNYCAYSPDVDGCVSIGDTVEETMRNFAEALKLHLDGLREQGYPIPQPSTAVDYVEVAA